MAKTSGWHWQNVWRCQCAQPSIPGSPHPLGYISPTSPLCWPCVGHVWTHRGIEGSGPWWASPTAMGSWLGWRGHGPGWPALPMGCHSPVDGSGWEGGPWNRSWPPSLGSGSLSLGARSTCGCHRWPPGRSAARLLGTWLRWLLPLASPWKGCPQMCRHGPVMASGTGRAAAGGERASLDGQLGFATAPNQPPPVILLKK